LKSRGSQLIWLPLFCDSNRHTLSPMIQTAEVIIVGGGLAGLSAAVYLGRAKRDALVIDAGKSMARWEPEVQNYLGFPDGISGNELLARARAHARRYHTRFTRDHVTTARVTNDGLELRGEAASYRCARLLLATGIFHIPPDLPGVNPCLGHSMFFCKDCDGYRVQGRTVVVYGWTDEAVEYALGMLLYTSCVAIVTDGRAPRWNSRHRARVREYAIPVYSQPITAIQRDGGNIRALHLRDGTEVTVDALFTTRGDIYLNKLARGLGAKVDRDGEIVVNMDMRTTVKGVYAAGCVTPANCQMIIAAGQGAIAAQAINRDLFEESLATHTLRRFRGRQLQKEKTRPTLRRRSSVRP
jgi:thioredoxin reductase (NADPH)